MDHTNRPEVIYLADPLCGWCFGIAPALEQAREMLGDRVTWRVRTGGLVVGERVRAVRHDAAYLRRGLQQVAEVTGRVAGERYFAEIVDRGTWISDSEPVCRAVMVADELGGSDAAFTASRFLSDSLYVHGREPDAPATVRDLAAALGVDAEKFVGRWASEAAAIGLQAHWDQTRALGLQTYPTIAIVRGDHVDPLVVGAAAAAAIVAAIEQRVQVAG
jgi:putative protein-disulfide isomerase